MNPNGIDSICSFDLNLDEDYLNLHKVCLVTLKSVDPDGVWVCNCLVVAWIRNVVSVGYHSVIDGASPDHPEAGFDWPS